MQIEKGIELFINANMYVAFVFLYEGLWTTIGGIKNSIGIAALIIGALLLIFLAILKLEIFVKLPPGGTGKLIMRMMTYVFILALVSIILGFVYGVLPSLVPSSNTNSNNTTVENKNFSNKDVIDPVVGVEYPIEKGDILKSALMDIAGLEKNPIIFNNCSDSFINLELRETKAKGKDHLDLMQKLQNYALISPQSMIYNVKLENDTYEINCERKK